VNNTVQDRFSIGNFTVDNAHVVVIKDHRLWVKNIDQIDQWLDDTHIRIGFRAEGMVLKFENKADMSLFLLTWGDSDSFFTALFLRYFTLTPLSSCVK
jgi:hypothetical protein